MAGKLRFRILRSRSRPATQTIRRILTMGHLSERAMRKVSGPAWQPLKDAFLEINQHLLAVAPDTHGDLTTIYIKYTLDKAAYASVFAVVWVKTSKRLIVGLALPEQFDALQLGGPPPGLRYSGLTKYLTICPGESVPSEFADWARAAYEAVKKKTTGDGQ